MSKVSELKRVKSTGKVTGEQMAELKALAEMPDERINLSDIPEITDWSGAVVGKYNRNDRIEITLRIRTRPAPGSAKTTVLLSIR